MLGKAAPKTTKPTHKAVQGWLRTDRGERQTDRQKRQKRQTEETDREIVAGRCEMTRRLVTEMNVEKLPV